MVTSASDTDQELGSVLDALSDATTPVEDAVTPVDTGGLDDALTGVEVEAEPPQETDEYRERLREFRQQFYQNVPDRVLAALNGDPVAKSKLSSAERRLAKRIDEWAESRVQARLADYSGAETPQQQFDRLYVSLAGMDPYTRMEYLENNPEDGVWYTQMVGWRKAVGLSPNASLAEIHAYQSRYEADEARKAAAAPRTAAPSDLDALYDELQQDETWTLLTDAERDQLDPDNFNQANPVRARRAMEALFHTLSEAAEARAPREPTTADKARALARRMPPGVTGGRTPGRVTFDQARDALLEARASGVGVAAAQETYERARKAAGLT